MRAYELAGQTFGKWTVLERVERHIRGGARWLCRCECGTERVIRGHNLRSGKTTECRQCADRARVPDYTGQRFGMWTVTNRADMESKNAFWACLCDCGAMAIVSGKNLRTRESTKCRSCAYALRRTATNDLTYRDVHQRLARDRGPASDRQCVACGGRAREWAYQHCADEAERLATMTGWQGGMVAAPYSTDLDHYAPMCRGCHVSLDRRMAAGA